MKIQNIEDVRAIEGPPDRTNNFICRQLVPEGANVLIPGEDTTRDDLNGREEVFLICDLDRLPQLADKAELVCKPRPHNKEVVVALSEDGEDVTELVERLKDQILEANEARNIKFLQQSHSQKLMRSAVEVYELNGYARDGNIAGKPLIEFVQNSMMKRVKQNVFGNRMSKRLENYHRVCEDPNLDVNTCGFSRVHPSLLTPGPCSRHDPMLGSVKHSLCSLLQSAAEAGREVGFGLCGWTIF